MQDTNSRAVRVLRAFEADTWSPLALKLDHAFHIALSVRLALSSTVPRK